MRSCMRHILSFERIRCVSLTEKRMFSCLALLETLLYSIMYYHWTMQWPVMITEKQSRICFNVHSFPTKIRGKPVEHILRFTASVLKFCLFVEKTFPGWMIEYKINWNNTGPVWNQCWLPDIWGAIKSQPRRNIQTVSLIILKNWLDG